MSFDLVFFGGTGDLTWRKLMPALFQAFRHGKLPAGGRILAVARDQRTDEEYRAFIKERFHEVDSSKRPSDEEFARFAELLHYRRMDLSQPEDYAGLKDWLDARGADTVVLYLATSPHLFPAICEQLGTAGLNAPHIRVVLEKPLGHDLASAQEINRVVRSVFREEQAFRIDHYLGKPSVQNLMALRFGNALFEPLWRRESIANIQITLSESIGVGTRGDFYDRTGALRDMIQNHALQLLTMIAMEPPSTSDADAIRDEKLKVLKSLKPFTPESVARDVVRGQYRAGSVGGQAVPGYQQEVKVPAGSHCETFVALRTEVQNWRWAGVPFYLRTGKRLAEGQRIISIAFREPPKSMFPPNSGVGSQGPDHLTFDLADASKMSLSFYGKRPGPGMRLDKLSLQFAMTDTGLAGEVLEAYERLILDAMRGDRTLFTTAEGIERLWEVSQPLLEAPPPVRLYQQGSWGPKAVHQLIAPHAWRLPFERAWRKQTVQGG